VEHEKWLVFEVSDTGCGVAKEGLRSLFQEYVQASARPQRAMHARTRAPVCPVSFADALSYLEHDLAMSLLERSSGRRWL
jgi:hypothetical protein